MANMLKELRLKEGIPIEKIALDAGVSARYLKFIEAGKKNPSLPVALKIAKSLKTTVDKIFDYKCTKSTSK